MSTAAEDILVSENRRCNVVQHIEALKKAFTTTEGLIGSYDYGYLFKPNLPFMRNPNSAPPFFGLDDKIPVLLALLLGLQHALAMLAGIITPPLVLSGEGGAHLLPEQQQYLVSTALIVSGILSSVQITRFRISNTRYYVGTGLISVVGISFSIIPLASGAFRQMYANGFCPSAPDGSKLPCPEGYGALLGTAACCALVEISISFVPPKLLQKIFPPIVTGPTVMLIGVSLIKTGFLNWAGGNGLCSQPNPPAYFALCPNVDASHALPWGSAQFIGLGLSVFSAILLCEIYGSPLMKCTSVVIGLLVGSIIASATGYFDRSGIDLAPAASFLWLHTFKLSIYGPLVIPMIILFIILPCETMGDVTATCDVSQLEVHGEVFDSRIQGGILADGINGLLATLMTITPMSTFAQNNGVIALTRCANRTAGYCCCIFLVIMGIFAKFAGALVSIPGAVIGGMTTFLFCAVAVSGIAIVSRAHFTRRNRFILTASLSVGYGATLVPTWFNNVFTYHGNNTSLKSFLDAIVLVLETGFAITAFIAIILNALIDEQDEHSQMPQQAPRNEHHETVDLEKGREVGLQIPTVTA